VPSAPKSQYRSNFLQDFWHLNVAMWTSNNALVPDPDKEPDALTSSPLDWPLLRVGLRMCGWGDDAYKFFLLGTPIIWWGGLISIIMMVISYMYYQLKWQRKIVLWSEGKKKHIIDLIY